MDGMFWVWKAHKFSGDERAKKGGVTKELYLEVLKEHLSTPLDADSIFMHQMVALTRTLLWRNVPTKSCPCDAAPAIHIRWT